MDRNFYTDSFERLLKEKSDEFRMYPARRVWYGIYNNLYPGRRYPSGIMSLTIIAAISLISFLNNTRFKNDTVIHNKNNSINNIATGHTIAALINKAPLSSEGIVHENNLSTTLKNGSSGNNSNVTSNTSSIKNKPLLVRQSILHNYINQLQDNSTGNVLKEAAIIDNENKPTTNDLNENNIEISSKKSDRIKDDLIDDHTISNEHFSKKWADKLVWQIYASPYVAYGEAVMPKTNSIQGQDNNSNFDNSSIGLEAGTAMQYSLSGLIKLKAGVQFNYASYNMEAYQNEFNSEMSAIIPKSGFAGSGISPVTLHNEMYQFSLPVGVEFKLLQKNNLQWNAGATVQPSFIAGGNTYLMSSDSHSFIDESSALNRWNFNAGFETFITYKVNGLTWQFGPQIRYQFSSAYVRAYTPVEEKLANFGVKIGVSKVIR